MEEKTEGSRGGASAPGNAAQSLKFPPRWDRAMGCGKGGLSSSLPGGFRLSLGSPSSLDTCKVQVHLDLNSVQRRLGQFVHHRSLDQVLLPKCPCTPTCTPCTATTCSCLHPASGPSAAPCCWAPGLSICLIPVYNAGNAA